MEVLEKIMVELQPLIVNAIIVIVGGLLGVVVKKVSDFFDAKMEKDLQDKIFYVIKSAVLAVDEVAPDLKIKGKEKYKLAVGMISRELEDQGIMLSEEELYMMIHAILQQMKKEYGDEE